MSDIAQWESAQVVGDQKMSINLKLNLRMDWLDWDPSLKLFTINLFIAMIKTI